MNKAKLNLRLLRKVRNRIAEIPESYDQQTFGRRDSSAPCGTVACLAGEAVICDSPSIQAGIKRLFRVKNRDIITYAGNLLGIEHSDAVAIFDFLPTAILEDGEAAVKWPKPFAKQFTKAKTPRARAKVAVAYLDECLKRKAVMW